MKKTDTKQKQRKFLEEYVNTLDLAASARAAGYTRQTGIANVRTLLKNPAIIAELKAICESKAGHLEVCKGFIIAGYLKILDWALALDDYGKPNDAAIALRALDGVVKQLGGGFYDDNKGSSENLSENPAIITNIKGLDPNKI